MKMNRFNEFQIALSDPDEAENAPEKEKKKEKTTALSLFLDVLDSAKTAIIVVVFLFTFVFRAVGVDGGSMIPTLNDRDWLAISASTMFSGVNRGDIVVVTQPWERNVPIIKRVIAKGGDTVDINFFSGKVSVNGVELAEDYTNTPTNLKYDVDFPVVVPEGCVFVMGDNRNDSLDSRSSQIGFVREDYILGRVLFRMYPVSEWKVNK